MNWLYWHSMWCYLTTLTSFQKGPFTLSQCQCRVNAAMMPVLSVWFVFPCKTLTASSISRLTANLSSQHRDPVVCKQSTGKGGHYILFWSSPSWNWRSYRTGETPGEYRPTGVQERKADCWLVDDLGPNTHGGRMEPRSSGLMVFLLEIQPAGTSGMNPRNARNERKVAYPIIKTDTILNAILFTDTTTLPGTTTPIRQLWLHVYVNF